MPIYDYKCSVWTPIPEVRDYGGRDTRLSQLVPLRRRN